MSSAVTTVDNSAILQKYIDSQAAATEKTTKTSATQSNSYSSITGDFNTFLKILTTQLQNQDPTSATDTNQFIQELVQFSAVEQQISTNDKLDKLINSVNSNGITPLLSYVGQYVEASSDGEIVVQGGVSQFSYNLPSAAQNVSIQIKDSSGKTVATLSGPVDKGDNLVSWDGKDSNGSAVDDGVYKVVYVAKDSGGDAITVDETRIYGRVTSVQTGDDGDVTLAIGNLELSDTDISAVFSG